MWKVLVKWNESTDKYINMVLLKLSETNAPIGRYHLAINTQTGELCRNHGAKEIHQINEAVMLVKKTAAEVHKAKQLLKETL
ncbi:MAG: hypothetical protein PHH77_09125 [Victivallaceae bacterium]|nr:hypothetical protein [Victivallaceae bacterium]